MFRRKVHRFTVDLRKAFSRLCLRNTWKIFIIEITFFGLLFLLYAAFIIGIFSVPKSPTPLEVCYSKPCNDSAEFLLKSLDRSVDPCENFHDFVCGNYMVSKHILINKDIEKRLIEVVDSFDTLVKTQDSDYIHKLLIYYTTCVKKYTIYTHDLKRKLDELTNWSIWNKRNSSNTWEILFNKFYQAGLKTDFLLNIQFVINPWNSSRQMVLLNVPNINYYSEEILTKELLIHLVEILGRQNVEKDIVEIVNFKNELIKVSSGNNEMVSDTIETLRFKFPEIRWYEFLNGILLPYAKLSSEDRVMYAMPFFERFYDLMTQQKPFVRVLVNYLKWQNVLNLGGKKWFNLEHMMYADMEENLKHLKSKDRKNICIQKMLDDMYLAMSALFVRHVFNNSTKTIQDLAENIRHSLYKNVEKVTWLSGEAKRKALDKISRIDLLIGHPPELLNRTIIEDYYRDLNISSYQFFINHWDFQKFQRRKDAQEFTRLADMKHWTGQFGRVTETSTMYTPQNIIIIAGGVSHPLFFDPNIPNYMNYGTLGALVGHEFAHALGDRLLNIDENNNYVDDWWDRKSSEKLLNKYECIVEKYSNYTYKEYNLRVDGKKTLEENVADITGLKAAYDAYVSLMGDEPREPHLSGLENFNAKQMFWIAYGSTFCEEKNSKIWTQEILDTDDHTPEHFRIIGAVSSLPEFAKDFNCTSTDFMNPIKKCPIWYE